MQSKKRSWLMHLGEPVLTQSCRSCQARIPPTLWPPGHGVGVTAACASLSSGADGRSRGGPEASQGVRTTGDFTFT
ncbi:unnamed protein product [Urochloa humidicola]